MDRIQRRSRCGQIIRTNLLPIMTLIGVALGLATGFGTRQLNPTDKTIMWIGMTGELYLRVMKMMIVPLVITAILSVTSSMDPKSNGRISAVCITYALIGNFIPSIIGCVLGMFIGPGYGVLDKATEVERPSNITSPSDTSDVFADLLRNFFPDNVIEATFLQTQTEYVGRPVAQTQLTSNGNFSVLNDTMIRQMTTVRSPNIIGLVLICTLFGIASGVLGDVSKPFQAFFNATNEIIMQVLRWIMWVTPVGVTSLIAKTLCAAEDIEADFRKLGMFILATLSGLILCGLCMPISYAILRRTNPFHFILSLFQPILMAFATASTPITMPAVMSILETDYDVDKRVCRFVMPFIMTLGRTGTSLYIAMSTIFVCQLTGTFLNVADIMLICLLTTITSTGAPPVPSSALMAVIIVTAALKIPTETVTLLYTFDWFLDRMRSIVNLLFQAFAAILTQDLCGKSLASLSNDKSEYESMTKTFPNVNTSIEIHIDENELRKTSGSLSDIADV